MKILMTGVLAAACAQPLAACDLCAIYTATEAQGGTGAGFYGGVVEQFTEFGSVYEDGHKVASEGGATLMNSNLPSACGDVCIVVAATALDRSLVTSSSRPR